MPAALIDHATTADKKLVNAVPGKRIRVHSLLLQAANAVNVTFGFIDESSTFTAASGALPEVGATGFTLPHNPEGWFLTGINEAFGLRLSGNVQVSGMLNYSLVG